MDKKKILIITQRFFPAPSPRSYRATELAKEMARQGHDVTVYAVLGNFNYSSFEKEFNLKIRNIGKPCFAILNSDNYVRHTFLDRALRKILNSIVEFPDIELTFKMFRILKVEKNVDLLITVTNPHPINWGCALTKHINKRIFPKIWIADCGDPYMGNAIRKHPPYFYFKYIEKGFCRMADFISVPFEGAIDAYYPEFHEKIKVIPQGFEFDQSNYNNEPPKNLIPTFAYAGTFIKGYRDPTMFLEYLATIHVQFKFIIFTSDISLIEPFIEKLNGKIEIHPYIPRNELLIILRKMNFLLNIENETTVHSPSKLIDYAIAGRPILSIKSTKIEKAKVLNFLNGDYSLQLNVELDKYRISKVVKQFLDLQ